MSLPNCEICGFMPCVCNLSEELFIDSDYETKDEDDDLLTTQEADE